MANQPDVGDLIIVDGQGDITKQVNDIELLASQQVDAILCIPNSGTAVVPGAAQCDAGRHRHRALQPAGRR